MRSTTGKKSSGMPNERGKKTQQCRCSHHKVITVYVRSCYDDCQETNIEQRSTIKFCWKAGKTDTETYELLQGDPFKMSQTSGVAPCKRRF